MLRDEERYKQVVDFVERYKKYTLNKRNKQNVYKYEIEGEMEKLIKRKLLKKICFPIFHSSCFEDLSWNNTWSTWKTNEYYVSVFRIMLYTNKVDKK